MHAKRTVSFSDPSRIRIVSPSPTEMIVEPDAGKDQSASNRRAVLFIK